MVRCALAASQQLAVVSGEKKQQMAATAAALLRSRGQDLDAANALDLAAAPSFRLSPAQVDRLRLSPSTIESMAVGLEEVAALPEPIGEVIESSIRPNGLEVLKVRVPLGVVFFIYELRRTSRPTRPRFA